MVRSGRTFLRRLIDLSTKATRLDHFIRLNAESRADLEWWYQFISPWNGVALLSPLTIQAPTASIYSDASGTWGCGAICQFHWFQLKWDKTSEKYHISIKELIPIVIATAIWGHYFKGKTLHVRSDNVAAVAAINNQTSSVKEMAHLLRCLAFIAARFQLRIIASHVPGHLNTIADALSRNNIANFFSLVPQADKTPSSIPDELIQLLIPQLPDCGVARPSWLPGLSEVITRAESPGLQWAWLIQYRSGALCAVSNGEFSKYCAKHNQHA